MTTEDFTGQWECLVPSEHQKISVLQFQLNVFFLYFFYGLFKVFRPKGCEEIEVAVQRIISSFVMCVSRLIVLR